MSTRPAQLLGLPVGTLKEGASADFVLIDEKAEYVYNKTFSRSTNSPWWNKTLRGKVVATYFAGKKVF